MDRLIVIIKWVLSELNKMFSNGPSFYSKKRIESGIAFSCGIFGMLIWLVINITKMSVGDITIWAAVLFSIAGYIINKIEKNK